MSAGDWIRAAQARGYADPPSERIDVSPQRGNGAKPDARASLTAALGEALEEDLLERAACLEGVMRWQGPEDAVGYMTAHGGESARRWWAGLRPADRHLYRRRAAAIVLEYIGRKAEA